MLVYNKQCKRINTQFFKIFNSENCWITITTKNTFEHEKGIRDKI